MPLKKRLGVIGSLLLDVFEIYIPVAAFSVMFTVFLLQVILRYIFNSPLTWPYEITLMSFIWLTLLGACLARRSNSHVAFGILYDMLSPRRQLLVRLIGNGIILSAFCVALYPSYDFVSFVHFQKTAVLRIPFSLVYFPYIPFLLLIMGHTIYDMVNDLKKIFKTEL